eukprot:CAMPEP_0113933810 /NCGR_PEP_ID=MMETSP1339-20121228/1126_1 /TAXON_ID=94617 /ORGANISM="Fibrocapsa japonica" /LENGTH=306 /DNA_ID=CAMNT_0000935287 /DNA_START=68 /DNA_END=988 /DNA_ORIENTATION=- /assembly_acc=CAM_ASM_000762
MARLRAYISTFALILTSEILSCYGCGAPCVDKDCVMIVTSETASNFQMNITWNHAGDSAVVGSDELGEADCDYYQLLDYQLYPEIDDSPVVEVAGIGSSPWTGYVFIGAECVNTKDDGKQGCFEFKFNGEADSSSFASCEILQRRKNKGKKWFVDSCVVYDLEYFEDEDAGETIGDSWEDAETQPEQAFQNEEPEEPVQVEEPAQPSDPSSVGIVPPALPKRPSFYQKSESASESAAPPVNAEPAHIALLVGIAMVLMGAGFYVRSNSRTHSPVGNAGIQLQNGLGGCPLERQNFNSVFHNDYGQA